MVDLFRDENNVLIEANKVLADNSDALAHWCGGVAVVEHDAFKHEEVYAGVNVPTPDGPKRASQGMWIVRLPEGSFYVVTDNMFRQLFTAES